MAAIPVNLVVEVNLPGQPEDGSNVRMVRLKCGNTLSEISGAGFLNPWVASQGLALYASDFVFAAGSNGNQIYKPVIAASGVITLTVLP